MTGKPLYKTNAYGSVPRYRTTDLLLAILLYK